MAVHILSSEQLSATRNLACFRECRSFKDDQMGLTDFMKKTVGLI